MSQTPSIFTDNLIITYAFYDAGPGHAGLPKQHQCSVSVTRNLSTGCVTSRPPPPRAPKSRYQNGFSPPRTTSA
jgi:hypothetical protein